MRLRAAANLIEALRAIGTGYPKRDDMVVTSWMDHSTPAADLRSVARGGSVMVVRSAREGAQMSATAVGAPDDGR
jgi:hypothetical protein